MASKNLLETYHYCFFLARVSQSYPKPQIMFSCVFIPFELVFSRSYLYPFYGIHYFVKHSDVWPFYLTILIPQLILTLAIYLVMFLVLYPIQFVLALLFYGPAGIFTSWFSVLQQASMVSAFIVTLLLMPEIQRVAFDAVLSKEFAHDLVLMAKLRRVDKIPFLVKCGRAVWAIPGILLLPFLFVKAIAMFVISAIPLIGPCIVIVVQAPSKGLRSHSRYFTLKGYDKKQIKQVYKKNRGKYMGFGLVANCLESIPILSVFFMFTNTIGAALWVTDIENRLEYHPYVFRPLDSANEYKFKHINTEKVKPTNEKTGNEQPNKKTDLHTAQNDKTSSFTIEQLQANN